MMFEDTEDESQSKISEMSAKAQDMGVKAQEKAEIGKEKVAEGIEGAVGTMRDKLPSDGMVGKAGTVAADSLEKTAGYLRDHETSELWAEVQEYVKLHPASSLVGALAAGFVLSRILR
jgi:hypothetical protein